MIGRIFRRRPQLQPFSVTALHQGKPPIRIGILATDRAQAILTAQELFPAYVIGVIALEDQWEDSPA